MSLFALAVSSSERMWRGKREALVILLEAKEPMWNFTYKYTRQRALDERSLALSWACGNTHTHTHTILEDEGFIKEPEISQRRCFCFTIASLLEAATSAGRGSCLSQVDVFSMAPSPVSASLCNAQLICALNSTLCINCSLTFISAGGCRKLLLVL